MKKSFLEAISSLLREGKNDFTQPTKLFTFKYREKSCIIEALHRKSVFVETDFVLNLKVSIENGTALLLSLQ
jgi:hypothetical protein